MGGWNVGQRNAAAISCLGVAAQMCRVVAVHMVHTGGLPALSSRTCCRHACPARPPLFLSRVARPVSDVGAQQQQPVKTYASERLQVGSWLVAQMDMRNTPKCAPLRAWQHALRSLGKDTPERSISDQKLPILCTSGAAAAGARARGA